MTSKEIKSFTIDEENAAFLSEHDNASSLMNDLVEQYRRTAERDTTALELELKQKRRELKNAKDRVKQLESDIEEIEDLIADFERESDAEFQETMIALENAPRDPQNPAVQNHAEKLGMTPSELVDELQRFHEG